MIELTDADRRLIASIWDNSVGAHKREIHAAFVAGLQVGIDRSAKVCDERERANAHSVGRSNGCAECAAAIRALNAPAAP